MAAEQLSGTAVARLLKEIKDLQSNKIDGINVGGPAQRGPGGATVFQ